VIENLEEILQPGDVLLYSGNGLVGWWIKIKTWSDVSHCETYIGEDMTAGSREPFGVRTFQPVRRKNLKYVYRPTVPFDFKKGWKWHKTVVGQRYDFLGLLVFYLAAKSGRMDRMFCSEHTARMANEMGIMPFGSCDCDRIAPGQFKATPAYRLLYKF
jgi:hypothetical protein